MDCLIISTVRPMFLSSSARPISGVEPRGSPWMPFLPSCATILSFRTIEGSTAIICDGVAWVGVIADLLALDSARYHDRRIAFGIAAVIAGIACTRVPVPAHSAVSFAATAFCPS